MSAERLLQYFDRISEAPGAVPRLRRFVFDLAVRGKLVEQDPRDELAAELLTRIEKEKQRGGIRGKVRNSKTQHLDNTPFAIPASWEWTQLAQIGYVNPRNEVEDTVEASFVPMSMIFSEYGKPHEHEVRMWADIKKGFTHFAEGDVGLAKITPCFENGKSTVFRGLMGGVGAGTTELHVVRPVLVIPEYILIFLKSPHFVKSGIANMTGTAGQKRLPTEYFSYSPFPLPPLAEQARIVARVSELMALCDDMDAAQAMRDERRDRLVAATLHGLDEGVNDSFDGNHLHQEEGTRFFLSHLPRLVTRQEHVGILRQTILDLAVRGKLVPQQGDVDPQVVINQVRHERAEEGVTSDISGGSSKLHADAVKMLRVPSSWTVAPLSDVALAIVDCPHATPQWTSAGKICVRTNQFRPGFLDLSESRFVSEETYLDRIARIRPIGDDILYSREGGILGIACRVPHGVDLCLGQRMMLIRSASITIPAFLELVLNSPFITGLAAANITGGAAPRVNVSTVKSYPIPVPPLDEQRRIVAKVNELLRLCDELIQQVTEYTATKMELLEALLHEAIGV